MKYDVKVWPDETANGITDRCLPLDKIEVIGRKFLSKLFRASLTYVSSYSSTWHRKTGEEDRLHRRSAKITSLAGTSSPYKTRASFIYFHKTEGARPSVHNANDTKCLRTHPWYSTTTGLCLAILVHQKGALCSCRWKLSIICTISWLLFAWLPQTASTWKIAPENNSGGGSMSHCTYSERFRCLQQTINRTRSFRSTG